MVMINQVSETGCQANPNPLIYSQKMFGLATYLSDPRSNHQNVYKNNFILKFLMYLPS